MRFHLELDNFNQESTFYFTSNACVPSKQQDRQSGETSYNYRHNIGGALLSVEGSKLVGVRSDGLQNKFDHNIYMTWESLGKFVSAGYAINFTQYTPTEDTQSVHVYLQTHQTIPVIQSKTTTWHTQHRLTRPVYNHISHKLRSWGHQ